ncbi:hypothetical protein [Thalassotalea maritima]|uniref:hypothetical protein n=1 Tax=Thalassotalea maritima TaxID=3242416 RepID=UPI003528D979
MTNLLKNLPAECEQEVFETILQLSQRGSTEVLIERIISDGQHSPADFWYCQQQDECVLIVQGHADIELERQGIIHLDKGDYLFIPRGVKHRVVMTSAVEKTIWLALHVGPKGFMASATSNVEVHIESISLAHAAYLLANIPELEASASINGDYLEHRIGSQPFIALAAFVNGQAVAVKLGYFIDNDVFYSWLGGVYANFRGQGLAKKLLLEQELRVMELGAKKITVKSMNRYIAMLQLLLSNGYCISGYEDNGDVNNNKILFTKTLCK